MKININARIGAIGFALLKHSLKRMRVEQRLHMLDGGINTLLKARLRSIVDQRRAMREQAAQYGIVAHEPCDDPNCTVPVCMGLGKGRIFENADHIDAEEHDTQFEFTEEDWRLPGEDEDLTPRLAAYKKRLADFVNPTMLHRQTFDTVNVPDGHAIVFDKKLSPKDVERIRAAWNSALKGKPTKIETVDDEFVDHVDLPYFGPKELASFAPPFIRVTKATDKLHAKLFLNEDVSRIRHAWRAFHHACLGWFSVAQRQTEVERTVEKMFHSCTDPKCSVPTCMGKGSVLTPHKPIDDKHSEDCVCEKCRERRVKAWHKTVAEQPPSTRYYNPNRSELVEIKVTDAEHDEKAALRYACPCFDCQAARATLREKAKNSMRSMHSDYTPGPTEQDERKAWGKLSMNDLTKPINESLGVEHNERAALLYGCPCVQCQAEHATARERAADHGDDSSIGEAVYNALRSKKAHRCSVVDSPHVMKDGHCVFCERPRELIEDDIIGGPHTFLDKPKFLTTEGSERFMKHVEERHEGLFAMCDQCGDITIDSSPVPVDLDEALKGMPEPDKPQVAFVRDSETGEIMPVSPGAHSITIDPPPVEKTPNADHPLDCRCDQCFKGL